MDALLKGAIFGAETVRGNFECDGRDTDEKGVGVRPPGEPGLEVRLAAEFVDEVAVVVEDGAVADDVGRAAGGVEFCDDLGVENPELAFVGGGGVDGEGRLAGDFGDEFDVVGGFFQERADFVGEGGFADSVSADESEFHFVGCAMATIYFQHTFSGTVLLAHFVGCENRVGNGEGWYCV